MAIKYIKLLSGILEWQKNQELQNVEPNGRNNKINGTKFETTDKHQNSEQLNQLKSSANCLLMIAPQRNGPIESHRHPSNQQCAIKTELVSSDDTKNGKTAMTFGTFPGGKDFYKKSNSLSIKIESSTSINCMNHNNVDAVNFIENNNRTRVLEKFVKNVSATGKRKLNIDKAYIAPNEKKRKNCDKIV